MPEPQIIAVLIVAFLVGAIAKGATGLGFPLFAVPAVALVVDPRTAVIVVSLPNLLINLIYLIQQGRPPQDWRRVVGLLVAGSVGILAGVYFLAVVEAAILALILGTLSLVYVATALRSIELYIRPGIEPPLGALFGAASGLLQGSTGAAGPPLAIYLRSIRVDKVGFVYYITAAFTIFNVVQVVTLWGAGLYSTDILPMAFLLSIPSVAGLYLGIVIQRRIDQLVFNRLLLGILAVLGINLVLRGLGIL